MLSWWSCCFFYTDFRCRILWFRLMLEPAGMKTMKMHDSTKLPEIKRLCMVNVELVITLQVHQMPLITINENNFKMTRRTTKKNVCFCFLFLLWLFFKRWITLSLSLSFRFVYEKKMSRSLKKTDVKWMSRKGRPRL